MGVFDKWYKNGGFFSKTKMRYVHSFGRRSTAFDRDAYEQETVRAIIDAIATHTAKAEAMHVVLDEQGRVKDIMRDCPFARMLNQRPNEIMSGFDLKYKLITQLQANTTALLYIDWIGAARQGTPMAMYPINYRSYEFVQTDSDGWAVRFTDSTGTEYALPLEDVVVLRKFYNNLDIGGDGNEAIYSTLDLMKAAGDGLNEALTVSNKIRGILKQKGGRFEDEDVANSAKKFAQAMKTAASEGGVVGMDLTEEYIPVSSDAYTLTEMQMKEIRDGLYRYFRTSENIVKSDYTESQWQAFYEAVLEPILIQMGQAFTNICFTMAQRKAGHRIVFTTSLLMHTSIQTKINILAASREIALFTTNELREMFGYAPVEDGDKRQVSLNYTNADKQDEYQGVADQHQPKEEQSEGEKNDE